MCGSANHILIKRGVYRDFSGNPQLLGVLPATLKDCSRTEEKLWDLTKPSCVIWEPCLTYLKRSGYDKPCIVDEGKT
jgi:hypothetical protein